MVSKKIPRSMGVVEQAAAAWSACHMIVERGAVVHKLRPTCPHGDLSSFAALIAIWGTPLPKSRGEKFLFCPSWKMWRIFREISCSHFSWKSKGENLRNFSPNFRCLFRPHLRNNLPEFRSQEIPS